MIRLFVSFFAILSILIIPAAVAANPVVLTDPLLNYLIQKQSSYWLAIIQECLIIGLPLALIGECSAATVFAFVKKLSPFHIVKSVAYANLISYPVMLLTIYFALQSFDGVFVEPLFRGITYDTFEISLLALILFLEIIVVIFEAVFIRRLCKDQLSLRSAFYLSIMNNAASFALSYYARALWRATFLSGGASVD